MPSRKKTVPAAPPQKKAGDRRSYENPLTGRYGSPEMSYVFSPQFKFSTWRRLWVALAEGEKVLGLPITEAQLHEMRAHLDEINFEAAEAKEREIRHDVMSHVYAYGLQCPSAKGIIHLGATSAYVTDNTDLIQMKSGLELAAKKVVNVIAALANFAEDHGDLPTLAFTHFQAAQPTTVGKRACLWIQDLLMDLEIFERLRDELPFLGVKGTTGTQASFLELFDGNYQKVQRLEHIVAERMGFKRVLPVSGQTYTRKVDYQVLQSLSGLAQSAHKFANDLRLLAHLKEVEEPFEKGQVGSSAMAYKRNPMRAERMTGLARHLITLALDPAMTAAEQWFERTLDDSSNKRISVPEAFLCADVILETWLNVAQNLVVYPAVIEARLRAELPFIATENILMEAVKLGGDRQELHERIRVHSQAAAEAIKLHGKPNDLLDRIAGDKAFSKVKGRIGEIMDPARYIGLASEQTSDFLSQHVQPVLRGHRDWLGLTGEVSV
ncbi:MAG: adenylosuccinate lyase [Planctomycetes bacterium]|nr:adenylosuccinate lyase [Planctomycetota bacterium]